MPIPVVIHVPGRWRFLRREYRRELPTSFDEVAEPRRLPLYEDLCSAPGELGRLVGIRNLLRIPKRIFKRLTDDQAAALLDAVPWMKVWPSPKPVFTQFVWKDKTYYLPSSHGMNMCALEYPLADEAFMKWVDTGDKAQSLMLVATICRELNPDADQVTTRGDKRRPLLSRSEASARCKELEGLPDYILDGVTMFFAGMKEFINNSYGKVLFEGADNAAENSAKASSPNTTPSLGWWGIYFSLATDGPFGRDVKQVYQASFHEVCLYLVDRIKQQKAREMQEALRRADFGKEA